MQKKLLTIAVAGALAAPALALAQQASGTEVYGTVNMALMQTLNAKISARGTLALNLTAGGTVAVPVLQGRLEVKNTFVSHNDFPSGVSDLNGVLLFDSDRIQIESLSGTTGGGTVALTGAATYHSGVVLLDFGATARAVRLRYPPGVSSTANADLRLTGNANSALLSGDVVVTKLAVSRKEAAALLSVSVRTFDRWAASGLIHASGVGHRKIFAVTELQRFLQETSKTITI